MTWLFLQVFLYCLASFLLGVLLTWFFAVRPHKKQVTGAAADVDTAADVDAAEATAADTEVSTLAGDPEAEAPAAVVASDADAAESEDAGTDAELAESPEVAVAADLGAGSPEAEADLVTPDVDADADSDAPAGDADADSGAPSDDPDTGESSAEAPLAAVSAGGDAPSAEVSGDAAAAGATVGVATATLAEPAGAPGPEVDPRFGEGSAEPLADGAAPSEEYVIKGNADSMLYHTTASPYYGRTIAEVWFRTEEDAQRAGFTAWNQRRRKKVTDTANGALPTGSAPFAWS